MRGERDSPISRAAKVGTAEISKRTGTIWNTRLEYRQQSSKNPGIKMVLAQRSELFWTLMGDAPTRILALFGFHFFPKQCGYTPLGFLQ